ncbi:MULTISPECIES: Tet(A)/Tet(B)/Tet(C) family tetracycline efflux MFS transporter [Serratia]|nr:Tet(A)/Tet(B)/Tet(C) family tetracycline efflux MFS transporter [Serratia marcescens]MDX7271671.1 Tet(A)/Tet(B)/Tet(C) family tetracycline efflux MFS transporter [Serratia marcescens]
MPMSFSNASAPRRTVSRVKRVAVFFSLISLSLIGLLWNTQYSITVRVAILKKPMLVILLTVLLDAVGIGLIMPILPALLRSLGGLDAGSVHYGALLAAYALMQFLFSPILGALSDRFGRRPVLLISLAGAAADYLLMAFAPTLAWLYLGRLLAGITGANMAVATAYVTDITPAGQRARRFGLVGAVFGVGFIVGPLLGGSLGEWHLHAPFLAAAAMNALNLIMAFFLLPESRKPRARAAEKIRLNPFSSLRRLHGKPGLLPLAGIYLIMALVSQAPATLWILYGQDRFGWSMMVAGLSLAGYGACHALSQAFAIGPLVARLGERKALLIGLAADALGLVLLSIATRGWAPFALLPFFAAGGMALPALQALMAHKVDDDHQGELQGTLASMGSLIGVAGPLVATALYAATRDVWPGLVWALAAALYLLVPLLLARSRERDAA